MDDLITGTDNVEDVIDLQKQLTASLAKGQFSFFRKWRSNNKEILVHLSEECKVNY